MSAKFESRESLGTNVTGTDRTEEEMCNLANNVAEGEQGQNVQLVHQGSPHFPHFLQGS